LIIPHQPIVIARLAIIDELVSRLQPGRGARREVVTLAKDQRLALKIEKIPLDDAIILGIGPGGFVRQTGGIFIRLILPCGVEIEAAVDGRSGPFSQVGGTARRM